MVRVSGLASGMDIDELVGSMMQAARVPLDTLEQKKQYAEWQRDDYRDINKSLLELDTLIKDGIGMKQSFTKKTVSVSDPNAISVKNTNSTIDFSGTVEVKNLATSAVKYGVISIMDPDAELANVKDKSFTIKAITKDGFLQAEAYKYNFKDGDTLNSVIADINSKSNVTAFYDKSTHSISFTAKNTGEGEIILGESFFDGNPVENRSFQSNSGLNASLTYNGLAITRSSNTFSINGAEITLKKENTGPITFSSSSNVEAVLDSVTQFVDKYNEIIANIKAKTSETKYRSYQPLTTAQRKDMTEDEIKLWETKAKSGTLRSDSVLNGLLTKMRTSLYSSVNGSGSISALSQIGITTTSSYLEGGKLEINKDKLREAILEDPNQVYNLFMKSGDTTDQMGLAKRLRADIKTTMANIKDKAGNSFSVNNTFSIGKLLNSYTTKIDSWEDKLTALETRYYNQFTAMEKAISKANSQSSSLSQYFS